MDRTRRLLTIAAMATFAVSCSGKEADNDQAPPANDIAPAPSPTSTEPPVVEPTFASGVAATMPPAPGRSSVWVYRPASNGSDALAIFARPGSDGSFTVRCDRRRGSLVFFRAADDAETLAVADLDLSLPTGSTLVRAFPDKSGRMGYAGTMPLRDPWLDKLIGANGLLEVDIGGRSPLSVPVSKPLKQVVEHCRSKR